jgi:hypothetical protein
MSDSATKRRATSGRSKQRRKPSAQRAPSRPAVPTLPGPVGNPVGTAPLTQGSLLAARARAAVAAARAPTLSRAEEYAYIRADLRRLLTIAAILLAVMLVLLFIVER